MEQLWIRNRHNAYISRPICKGGYRSRHISNRPSMHSGHTRPWLLSTHLLQYARLRIRRPRVDSTPLVRDTRILRTFSWLLNTRLHCIWRRKQMSIFFLEFWLLFFQYVGLWPLWYLMDSGGTGICLLLPLAMSSGTLLMTRFLTWSSTTRIRESFDKLQSRLSILLVSEHTRQRGRLGSWMK